MANNDHIAMLMKGGAVWNAWRQENRGILLDLREAILSDANLTEANLVHAHLTEANLARANLSGAHLDYADLSGVNFESADLRRAGLCGAILTKAFLGGADLTEANFGGADLTGAYLRANLRGANLRRANLRGADLSRADLTEADLSEAKLNDADLSQAKLTNTKLNNADLVGANLSWARLREATLSNADLSGANLRNAHLRLVDLSWANLSEANLRETLLIEANLKWAHLIGANLASANLSRADLSGATLSNSILVDTNLTGADLTGCHIYGVSAWGLKLDAAKQQDLVVTPPNEPEITVDNIEVAQFIYLMLNNQKIRDVINTIASKTVLILGRFTKERKAVLDALREELRKRGYLPILFDFEVPATRDITETVSLLARMARFIIADLTDPSSIPKELEAFVPGLAVPVQPLLEGSARPYSMFKDYWKYEWVLPVYRYEGLDSLLATVAESVIAPAERKVEALDQRRRTIEAELTKP